MDIDVVVDFDGDLDLNMLSILDLLQSRIPVKGGDQVQVQVAVKVNVHV